MKLFEKIYKLCESDFVNEEDKYDGYMPTDEDWDEAFPDDEDLEKCPECGRMDELDPEYGLCYFCAKEKDEEESKQMDDDEEMLFEAIAEHFGLDPDDDADEIMDLASSGDYMVDPDTGELVQINDQLDARFSS